MDFNTEPAIIFYSERLRDLMQTNDYFSIIATYNEFENKLFQPALELLKQKQIKEILIISEEKKYYKINSKLLLKWWQKKKPVLELLSHV